MKLIKLFGLFAITFCLTVFAVAQTTTTTTVTKKEIIQNPDGTYTVIEYPVGKEVVVNLTPPELPGAIGSAKIMRSACDTTVAVSLSGLPDDADNYYIYAVDPNGEVSLLGPVMVDEQRNGVATFNTPLNKFMLVVSQEEGLSTIGKDTAVVFRSAVPKGYAVVPVGNRMDGMEMKEKQVATSDTVASTYEVPLLNVPSFNNKTTEIRINFSGELSGLKGKAYIDPGKAGTTQIKMRFDDMKLAPQDKRFVLWASSPEGEYVKLGQVINTGKRQEAEIRSETSLRDFGLFVTVEETDVLTPTSKVYSVFSDRR